ncbi:hypothetical protein MTR67_002187 [Solanum verrucosum]|uniref:Uncharacterized protein n=1 Tax=Solanum verrucosum TaxID=315347 RepID=A0AAF0PQ25_SOLVR|nr:hypothetical protein MTR67_002187 [Solanum verrucosum]
MVSPAVIRLCSKLSYLPPY